MINPGLLSFCNRFCCRRVYIPYCRRRNVVVAAFRGRRKGMFRRHHSLYERRVLARFPRCVVLAGRPVLSLQGHDLRRAKASYFGDLSMPVKRAILDSDREHQRPGIVRRKHVHGELQRGRIHTFQRRVPGRRSADGMACHAIPRRRQVFFRRHVKGHVRHNAQRDGQAEHRVVVPREIINIAEQLGEIHTRRTFLPIQGIVYRRPHDGVEAGGFSRGGETFQQPRVLGERDPATAPLAGAVTELYLAHDAVDVGAKIIIRQMPDLKQRHPHITAVAGAAAELRHRQACIFKAGTGFYFFAAGTAFATNDDLVDAAHAVSAQHVKLAGKGKWSFQKGHNRLVLRVTRGF